MSREFTKVSPRVWNSTRFRALPDDSARLVYLYYLTSRHQCSWGAYMVPDAYAASDLGWGVEEISKAREALVQSGLIHFDNATDELFIDQWFEHNPPTNEKHAKGVRNRIGEIYSDTIRERVEVSFEESDVKRIAKAEQKKREYELTKAKRQLGQNSNVTSLADTDFIRGFGAR